MYCKHACTIVHMPCRPVYEYVYTVHTPMQIGVYIYIYIRSTKVCIFTFLDAYISIVESMAHVSGKVPGSNLNFHIKKSEMLIIIRVKNNYI